MTAIGSLLGHSRSPILVYPSKARMRLLLVNNIKLYPISHRFQVITVYWLYYCFWHAWVPLIPSFGVNSWTLDCEIWLQKLETLFCRVMRDTFRYTEPFIIGVDRQCDTFRSLPLFPPLPATAERLGVLIYLHFGLKKCFCESSFNACSRNNYHKMTYNTAVSATTRYRTNAENCRLQTRPADLSLFCCRIIQQITSTTRGRKLQNGDWFQSVLSTHIISPWMLEPRSTQSRGIVPHA